MFRTGMAAIKILLVTPVSLMGIPPLLLMQLPANHILVAKSGSWGPATLWEM